MRKLVDWTSKGWNDSQRQRYNLGLMKQGLLLYTLRSWCLIPVQCDQPLYNSARTPSPSFIHGIFKNELIPIYGDRDRRKMPQGVGINDPFPRWEVKQLQPHRNCRRQHQNCGFRNVTRAVGLWTSWKSTDEGKRWREGVQDPHEIMDRAYGDVERHVVGIVESGHQRQVKDVPNKH